MLHQATDLPHFILYGPWWLRSQKRHCFVDPQFARQLTALSEQRAFTNHSQAGIRHNPVDRGECGQGEARGFLLNETTHGQENRSHARGGCAAEQAAIDTAGIVMNLPFGGSQRNQSVLHGTRHRNDGSGFSEQNRVCLRMFVEHIMHACVITVEMSNQRNSKTFARVHCAYGSWAVFR
jgi:hypothetical protein